VSVAAGDDFLYKAYSSAPYFSTHRVKGSTLVSECAEVPRSAERPEVGSIGATETTRADDAVDDFFKAV
jgi:hypothetical protein